MPETHQTMDREAEAEAALTTTHAPPALAWCLVLLFLATIFSVPAIQNISDWNRSHSFTQLKALNALHGSGHIMPSVAAIDTYETSLSSDSVVAGTLLPIAQTVMIKMGIGNEQAYLGRSGWLYYRPDVDYVTGPGFLDPGQLARRARAVSRGSSPVQPDPVRALVHFRDQLAARGIALLVVPAPVKTIIDPEWLTGRANPGAPENPSYQNFLARMKADNIQTLDLTGALIAQKSLTQSPQFLRTDTHWTPAAMESAAQEVAQAVRAGFSWPSTDSGAMYEKRQVSISNRGDIAVMLRLPRNQTVYPPQRVIVDQIRGPGRQLWQPSRNADILLLGDSFSNIYSRGDMGWGESAGLAEHLSFALQRPIDKIAVNSGGAYSSRLELAHELSRGQDRLSGKKLVIYQFAARDLASGDWKLLDLPPPGGHPANGSALSPVSESLVIQGKIKDIIAPPKPNSSPYPECIIPIHLVNIKAVGGQTIPKEVVVFVWGMRNNKWTPRASYTRGQNLTIHVTPWSVVSDKYDSYQRQEFEDIDTNIPIFWGEKE